MAVLDFAYDWLQMPSFHKLLFLLKDIHGLKSQLTNKVHKNTLYHKAMVMFLITLWYLAIVAMAVELDVVLPPGLDGYKPEWHLALADRMTVHAVKPAQAHWTPEECPLSK